MLRGVGVFSVGPTKPHPSRSLGFYPTKDGTLLFIGRSRDWPAVGPQLSLFPGFPHSPVGSESGLFQVTFPWLHLETLHFSSSKWQ